MDTPQKGNKNRGRKPLIKQNKKVPLRIFVEQYIVDDNGGEEKCKQQMVEFLETRAANMRHTNKQTHNDEQPVWSIEPEFKDDKELLEQLSKYRKPKSTIAPAKNKDKPNAVPLPGQVVYYQGSTYIFISMNMGGKCRLAKRMPPHKGKVLKDIDVSQIQIVE